MPEPVVGVALVVMVEVLQVLEEIAITTIIMEEEDVPNPIEGIVMMTVVVVSGIYGLNASQRRRKARLLHQRTKKQLDILDDEDAFWNEERIKKEVKRNYFIIQEAWSKKDLETLKDYLTPQLLDAWQTKMNWYEFQERRNELTNIKLIKQHVVNVYDSENDDEDYFWV